MPPPPPPPPSPAPISWDCGDRSVCASGHETSIPSSMIPQHGHAVAHRSVRGGDGTLSFQERSARPSLDAWFRRVTRSSTEFYAKNPKFKN